MLKELMNEVTILQDKERFLDKLLPQCISLINAYSENNKSKTRLYIDKIDNLIREYNNEEAE